MDGVLNNGNGINGINLDIHMYFLYLSIYGYIRVLRGTYVHLMTSLGCDSTEKISIPSYASSSDLTRQRSVKRFKSSSVARYTLRRFHLSQFPVWD